jgi:hypothetical protein
MAKRRKEKPKKTKKLEEPEGWFSPDHYSSRVQQYQTLMTYPNEKQLLVDLAKKIFSKPCYTNYPRNWFRI